MDDKLMYISANYDKQKYPFCRSKLLVDKGWDTSNLKLKMYIRGNFWYHYGETLLVIIGVNKSIIVLSLILQLFSINNFVS